MFKCRHHGAAAMLHHAMQRTEVLANDTWAHSPAMIIQTCSVHHDIICGNLQPYNAYKCLSLV